MAALETLAQYTSDTLTSFGITKPSKESPTIDNQAFAWSAPFSINIIVVDEHHVLDMAFDPDRFTNKPCGRIHLRETRSYIDVKTHNLPQMAAYMLQLIRKP